MDITSKILADAGADNIALTGAAYTIALAAGSTSTYAGDLSGTGTIEVSGVGSTLILTGISSVVVPSATEYFKDSFVASSAGSYDGYAGHAFRGGIYTLMKANAASVIIDKGATLQYGKTTYSNAAGTSLAGDNGYISSTNNGYNVVNIDIEGTLRVEYTGYNVQLGLLSGTGDLVLAAGSAVSLIGANTFSGSLVNVSGIVIGSDHIYGSIDNVSHIFSNGTITLNTPYFATMEVSQNIYENHWGNDININPNGGTIVLGGVYSYTDSANDNPDRVDNEDAYSLDPTLSNAALNFTELSGNTSGRGITIEGGILQLGDGKSTNFFLPGNNATAYIDLRSYGILGFDYSNSGATYDNTTIAGGGLSFYSLNGVGVGTVIFKQGDIVVTNKQYYNGTTQIDAAATVQLGDGTTGDTKSTTLGIYQSSAGDGSFLEAGQTTTVKSLDSRDGSTATGASTNKLIDNGTLIVDNVGATFFDNLSGSGLFIQAGAGVTTFGTGITYTGITEIAGGTLALALGSGGSLAQSSEVELLAAATVKVYGAQDTSSTEVTVGAAALDVSQAGNQTIQAIAGVAGTYVYLGATALTVGNSLSTTYAGTIADGGIAAGVGGSLVKIGSGTLTLTGIESYTGATTIDAGALLIGAGGSIASSGAVDLAVSGTSLTFASGAVDIVSNLSGVAGTTVSAAGAYLTIDDSVSTTYAGVISAGGLIKTGAGDLTLSATEYLTGDVVVEEGTLTLAAGTSLNGHMLKLDGSAIADLSATSNMTIEAIGGGSASEILLGDGVLTMNVHHAMTYAGTIKDGTDGAGSIQIGGSRSLTLSGDNTYSGGTTIQAGTLILEKADSAGTGAINFVAGTSTGNLYLEAGSVTATIASLYSNDNLYVGGFTKGDSLTTSYDAKTGIYTLSDQHSHSEALTFATTMTTTPTLESTTVNSSGYAVLTGKSKAA